MNRIDIDRAIDRYLDGAMSASERTSFLEQMDRDPQIARALSTERAIRSALVADRASLPIDRASGRAEFLSSLATLPAPTPAGVTAGATFAAGSSMTIATIGSVVMAAVVLLVGLNGWPLSDREMLKDSARSRAASSAGPTMLSRDTTTPAAIGPRTTAAVDAENAAHMTGAPSASESSRTGPASTATSITRRSSSDDVEGPRLNSQKSSEAAATTSTAIATPAATTAASATEAPAIGQVAADAAELPVIERDSVDLDVKLEGSAR
jgi:hypothetical protein